MIVVITVVIAIAFRDELSTLRGQVIAALTGTTNWYLIANEGSYFEQAGPAAGVPAPVVAGDRAAVLPVLAADPGGPLQALRRPRARGGRSGWSPRSSPRPSTWRSCSTRARTPPGLLRHLRPAPGAAHGRAARHPVAAAGAASAGRPRAHGSRVTVDRHRRARSGCCWMMHVADDRSAFMYRGGFLLAAILSALVVAALTHPNGALGRPARRWARRAWSPSACARTACTSGTGRSTCCCGRASTSAGRGAPRSSCASSSPSGCAELCYRLVERPWHTRAPSASLAGRSSDRLAPPGGGAPRCRASSPTARRSLAVHRRDRHRRAAPGATTRSATRCARARRRSANPTAPPSPAAAPRSHRRRRPAPRDPGAPDAPPPPPSRRRRPAVRSPSSATR